MLPVIQFISIEPHTKAGKYLAEQDIRCYQPPPSYCARAELIDTHPVTYQPLTQSEWWLFLSPNLTT